MKIVQKTVFNFLLSASLLGGSGLASADILSSADYNNALMSQLNLGRNAALAAREQGLSGESAAKFIAEAVNPSSPGFKLEGHQQVSSVATAVFCAANAEKIPRVTPEFSARESALVTQAEPGTRIDIYDCDRLLAAINGESGISGVVVGANTAGAAGGAGMAGAAAAAGGTGMAGATLTVTTAAYVIAGNGVTLALTGGGGNSDNTPVSGQ